MIPADKLKRWRELADRATPGPLVAEEEGRGGYNIHGGWHSITQEPDQIEPGVYSLINKPELAMCKRYEDAALFAESRSALPTLLDEVEASHKLINIVDECRNFAERECDRLRAALAKAHDLLRSLDEGCGLDPHRHHQIRRVLGCDHRWMKIEDADCSLCGLTAAEIDAAEESP